MARKYYLRTLLTAVSALFLDLSCNPDLSHLRRQRDASTDQQRDGAGQRYDGSGGKLHFDEGFADRDNSDAPRSPDANFPDARRDRDLGAPLGYDGPRDASSSDLGRDAYVPDARPSDSRAPDASLADRAPSLDALVQPDALPDAADRRDAGSPDARADGSSLCPGAPPPNTNQAGVCAGSSQQCGPGGWEDNYTTIAGYESVEVSCDGLDNDCDTETDEELTLPSRSCTAGAGACERPGLEYLTCLGSTGWSTTYSGCDAVAGDPSPELCNEEDDDCNAVIDDLVGPEALDDFNRPNQAGLGANALGNDWTNYGSPDDLDDFDIEGNEAVADWTGATGTNPLASSEIGYRNTFDITLMFQLSDAGEVGDEGGLIYGVNCTAGSLDGYVVRLGVGDSRTHRLERAGVLIADVRVSSSSSQRLRSDTSYMLRLSYDGALLQAKLWEAGASEPGAYLLSASATPLPSTAVNTFMTVASSVQVGQDQIATVDDIVNAGGCDL